MKIFQIFEGFCYWDATKQHPTLESTKGLYSEDIIFVEAPDYVFEHWGFDETKSGDERFIQPTAPDGWRYNPETGGFINENIEEIDPPVGKYLDNNLQPFYGYRYNMDLKTEKDVLLNISKIGTFNIIISIDNFYINAIYRNTYDEISESYVSTLEGYLLFEDNSEFIINKTHSLSMDINNYSYKFDSIAEGINLSINSLIEDNNTDIEIEFLYSEIIEN